MRAVVIADDRRAPYRIADEHGEEDHGHVHEHPVGRHAVLPRVLHELAVVEHAYHGHGDVGHELGGAVGQRLFQGGPIEPGPAQAQEAGVPPDEVQEGQKVIDTGLYSIVRHPMYSATLFLFLSIPLVLGSIYSFLIFLAYPFIIVMRIKSEEEFLEKELDGYREYKQKVKYRLIPFLW